MSKSGVLVAILLLCFSTGMAQQDGSVLERRVTISQNNQALAYILEQLSWQTGVYFSYEASLFDDEAKYSLEIENLSLFTVLTQLFDQREFQFSELENQIIIKKRKVGTNSLVVATDSIPVKYFFLSGRLVSSKRGDPIRYANIAIQNRAIGTISNMDGDFLLKIHPDHIMDTVVISCLGYRPLKITASSILDEDLFVLQTMSIKLKEVKVVTTSAKQLLDNVRKYMDINYCDQSRLLTSFYRETVKQNEKYINVSEAVLEVLKAPYTNHFKTDLVRMVKGRKSPDVQPFQWVNFKLQGGPFTITKLDVVKTMENFLDKRYENLYKYRLAKTIWYNTHPVYVLEFESLVDLDYPRYSGEIFIHRDSYAIVHAHFWLNKGGLRQAENVLIKKKPRGVKARPSYVHYTVNYRKYKGKWHLSGAQASVKIKIRSRREKLNSEFHSVSDLLITDIQPTQLKRFPKNEAFRERDFFVELLGAYDPSFWENYNIIKPDEDLRRALQDVMHAE